MAVVVGRLLVGLWQLPQAVTVTRVRRLVAYVLRAVWFVLMVIGLSAWHSLDIAKGLHFVRQLAVARPHLLLAVFRLRPPLILRLQLLLCAAK